MTLAEIRRLVNSTADAAFAVDATGHIAVWNRAAEDLFGVAEARARGASCGEVIRGTDERGHVCSRGCSVLQCAQSGHPLRNFDLMINTPSGVRWCNVSILFAVSSGSTGYSIHVVRMIDTPKRLEMLIRDFVLAHTSLPPADVANLMLKTNRASTSDVPLTPRELEILKRVALGQASTEIAGACGISRTTANNHIQHVLQKLGAHSRLEAVRKAEHAGLI